MASDSHKFQMTLRTPSASLKPQRLYILVMGLTGAGKSTFISIVTGKPFMGEFFLYLINVSAVRIDKLLSHTSYLMFGTQY